MKKFTLILTIAVLCSFAVVRRKEEQDTEVFFQNAITRVMEDENIAYHANEAESHIAESELLYRDQPVSASRVLNGAFDDVLLVDDGLKTSWVDVAELKKGYQSRMLGSFSLN